MQILRSYTENLDFFKKLIAKHGQDYHHRCCSVLKYEFCSKDSNVIEHGINFLYILFYIFEDFL